MISVKRSTSSNLKYTPNRHRRNLDSTAVGPALKLAAALLAVGVLALMTIFVFVPLLSEWLQEGGPLFSDETAAAMPTATVEPANPILSNPVGTVQFGEGYGMPAAVVDPSIYENEILFATGADENACDRLVRLDPETGAFENIEVTRENDTLRYPVENADTIVYIDAKTDGGGSIRMLNKTTGENTVLCDLAGEIPKLQFEAPYLVWTERADGETGKLMVCDVTTGELVTLAVLTDASYAASDPSLKSGQVLYADADAASEGNSLIRTVLLSDGSRWDYAAGSYVHDPKSAGDRWAYLSGNHDGDSDLYVCLGGGSPRRVARGVVDFAITPTCVVFNRDETVFAYVFSDDKTYVLSGTGTNSQLVAAGGDYALWRDMTDPASPVWKYIRVV